VPVPAKVAGRCPAEVCAGGDGRRSAKTAQANQVSEICKEHEKNGHHLQRRSWPMITSPGTSHRRNSRKDRYDHPCDRRNNRGERHGVRRATPGGTTAWTRCRDTSGVVPINLQNNALAW